MYNIATLSLVVLLVNCDPSIKPRIKKGRLPCGDVEGVTSHENETGTVCLREQVALLSVIDMEF